MATMTESFAPIDYGSRAPTYYHWSQDKPCTSNQTYGFLIKDNLSPGTRRPGIASDYTRPFSNLGFFPEIASTGGLVAQHGDASTQKPKILSKSMSSVNQDQSSINRFNINRGYTMGVDPIHKRLKKSQYPSDVRISRFQSAPPVYKQRIPKEKDIYLWHSLSGCLVHVKNAPPPPADRSMFIDRQKTFS